MHHSRYLENLHRPNYYVILLHCPRQHSFIQGPLGGTANTESIQAAIAKEETKEKAFLETLSKKLRDYKIGGKVKSVSGKAEEIIVKVAKDENVSFIVIGCRGKSKVRRTLMGSVTDYVIHHSHVPVFLCRHDRS
ncbi:hypothetical protein ACJMK2_016816 [Sinanodonta woodiana]|uniref:UspA domain-containing protein n=1 Tax=Sinanodonta woodiana TaxID=1069815 RepID=A0ABD3UWY3_SINWO